MRLGTIAFLLGIVCIQHLRNLPDPGWCWLLIPLAPALFWLPRIRFVGFLLMGALWTVFYAHAILAISLPSRIEGRDVIAHGVIDALPETMARRTRFVFRVSSLSRNGRDYAFPARVRLNWYGHPPPLAAGEEWRLKVRLKRPRGYMNPGGFDYEGWLFRQHIRATGYVRGDGGNRRLGRRPYAYAIAAIRQGIAEYLSRTLNDSPYSGIITALTVGDRHGISPEQWRVFNATGTTHLVAISGLHIGLVAGLLFFAVRRLWAWSGLTRWMFPAPRAAALAAVAGALCYAALAGFSVPTLRAMIMLTVVMLAVFRQRHYPPSLVLCMALFLVLLIDPLSIMGIGLWLSFLAVAVILYGMGGRLAGQGLWWKWGRMQWIVAVGLVPLLLLSFQHASISAPLANVVAVPWVSFTVVPPALLGLALHGISPTLGALCLKAAAAALGMLWPVLHWLSRYDPGIWLHHTPAVWAALAGVVGSILLLAPRGLPGRYLGVVFLMPLFVSLPPAPAVGRVWFTLLDVGQGLSAVVRTHTHVLVYDTGPRLSSRFDTGAAVVVPFLRHSGIPALDTLVVSHGDNDHFGGARSILKAMTVDRVLTSVPARLPGPHTRRCNDRQAWNWDGVRFTVINPPLGASVTGNDASCVVRIEDNAGHVILLTGDIERSAEMAMVHRFGSALAADIMTAPHHGSDTSSTGVFVNAVKPDYVLFPVGYRNRYGFPKADVVSRYMGEGAILYRTDRNGAITFRIGRAQAIAPPRLYRRDQGDYWTAY